MGQINSINYHHYYASLLLLLLPATPVCYHQISPDYRSAMSSHSGDHRKVPRRYHGSGRRGVSGPGGRPDEAARASERAKERSHSYESTRDYVASVTKECANQTHPSDPVAAAAATSLSSNRLSDAIKTFRRRFGLITCGMKTKTLINDPLALQ